MILTDPFIVRTLHPADIWRYIIEGVLAVGVVIAGKLICAARHRRAGPDRLPVR